MFSSMHSTCTYSPSLSLLKCDELIQSNGVINRDLLPLSQRQVTYESMHPRHLFGHACCFLSGDKQTSLKGAGNALHFNTRICEKKEEHVRFKSYLLGFWIAGEMPDNPTHHTLSTQGNISY
uniref:Uncharacterized protein n=1 Tax=Pyxicephalus adspersus TaxID=30357 RepID=A0AAV3B7Q6_PYXAD|nr:TPA: hypothetical protein GDO54_007554 [Pyxicephalus adspersus]